MRIISIMSYYNTKKKKRQWHREPLMLLLYRLIAILLLFSFSRWMLYMLNMSFFPNLHLFESLRLYGYGLRFDLVVLAYINIPVILYYTLPFKWTYRRKPQLIIDIYYTVANSLIVALNLVDTIYFRFIGKRMTSELFQFFGDKDENVGGIIGQLAVDYWYMVLFGILSILLIIALASTTRLEKDESPNPTKWRTGQIINLLIMAPLTVLACRGGIQSKPLKMIDALQYTEPHHVPIVLNTPFTIAKGSQSHVLQELNLVEDSDYEPIVGINPPVRFMANDSLACDTLPDNVVLIILESFGQEMIGYYNPLHANNLTPFLDSLLRESLTFDGRANGRRSIESLPSILSGLPSLMEVDFPTSSYFSNDLDGFGENLKAHGYSTSIFHGGNNGTMNFDIFSQQVGFDDYYGRDEYNNDDDYDHKWGIFDGPFLQYFANNLDTIRQPFASIVYTLSSHHPFNLPEGFVIPHDTYNWSSFEKTVYYTDCALRDFFATAKTKEWFSHTLFVITADHANTEHFDHNFNNVWGMYAIPIAFYYPGKIDACQTDEMAQQVDLGPSILSALHVNDTIFTFGRNLFDTIQSPEWVSYINQTYQYSDGHYLIQSDGAQAVGVFNLDQDKAVERNLINHIQCPDLHLRLQKQLQSYTNRMINNKLIYEQATDSIHNQPNIGENQEKEPA